MHIFPDLALIKKITFSRQALTSKSGQLKRSSAATFDKLEGGIKLLENDLAFVYNQKKSLAKEKHTSSVHTLSFFSHEELFY